MRSGALITAAMLMVLSTPSSRAEDAGHARLNVNLVGFENDNGRAMIALVNHREQFLSREHSPYRTAAVQIVDGHARWVLQGLPPGTYAISVYHDQNDNGELDSNLLRIPKESYGFSNDARKLFGPPDYEAASFTLDRPQLTITITVK